MSGVSTFVLKKIFGICTGVLVSESCIQTLASKACWMVEICCATTDNTSTSIRLNSSKQAQAPALENKT